MFTRSAEEEAQAKKIIPGRRGRSTDLFAKFIGHTRAVAQRTKYDLHMSYSRNHKGTCFGEKLANEVEGLFVKGYKRVLIIGNDCPQLSDQELRLAESHCRKGKLVIGPAFDGGIYLMALSAKQFKKKEFQQLLWETPELQKSLQEYVNRIGVTRHCLAPLHDVDSLEHLVLVAKELSQDHILLPSILKALNRNTPQFIALSQRLIDSLFLGIQRLRAPPLIPA